ncbi:hypothetical protein K502DRAFT_287553 [Neoconidiobolus thromboides FSU 785]|nr:hypothetical protein K502DRAFT_287553 [Neoconidiobolus thromboides FSU 785]
MCPKIKYLLLKMIDLYECHPTEKHYLIYSEDAKFEDPLCDAKNRIEVKTQFNAMPKVFEQAKIVRAKVVSIKDKNDAIVEVQLELWQLYSVVGKLVPMKSLVILDIDSSQSKITRHLDLWNYEAAWFNKNLLVKFIWNGLRRLNGKLLPLIA